jgi:hypothetical protein
MNDIWLRRLLVILLIGGGFTGVALITEFVFPPMKSIARITLLGFVCIYCYGIFIGLKLSEGTASLKYLRLYFALQIPFVSSPIITYRFGSGLQVTLAITESGLTSICRLGSEFQFAISSSAPWGIGVNFVGLAILFLLYSRLVAVRDDAASKPS